MLKGNFKSNYSWRTGRSFQLGQNGKYEVLALNGKPLEFEDSNPADTPRIPTMDWCNFAIDKAKELIKGRVGLLGIDRAFLELDCEHVIPTFLFKNLDNNQKTFEIAIADFLLRLTFSGDAEKMLRNEIARNLGLEEIS